MKTNSNQGKDDRKVAMYEAILLCSMSLMAAIVILEIIKNLILNYHG